MEGFEGKWSFGRRIDVGLKAMLVSYEGSEDLESK